LQVLDQHLVSLRSFAAMRMGNEIRITFLVDVEQGAALRTRELLAKLQDIQCVDCFAASDGICQTLAVFKVLCDHESRLPLLQIISSLNAQVLAIRADFVAFQLVGSPQDIEGLHASLLPYGLVEAVSVASTALRKQVTAPVATKPATPRMATVEPMKASRTLERDLDPCGKPASQHCLRENREPRETALV
jgi:acetolactate synthase small subunit